MERENIKEDFLNVAKKISDEVKNKLTEIKGITISGSISRKASDEFSDIDIDLWISKEDYEKWKENCPLMDLFGKYNIKRETPSNYSFGIDKDHKIDISLISIEDLIKSEWTIEQKSNKQHSIIVHDPEGRVKQILREKLEKDGGDFLVKDRKPTLVPNKDFYKFYISAYLNYFVPLCLARKQFGQAHFNMNFAIDLLLNLVWIERDKFYPYEKSKWEAVERFLNEEQKDLINRAQIIKAQNEEDVKRRRRLLRDLYSSLGYKEISFYHGKVDLS